MQAEVPPYLIAGHLDAAAADLEEAADRLRRSIGEGTVPKTTSELAARLEALAAQVRGGPQPEHAGEIQHPQANGDG